MRCGVLLSLVLIVCGFGSVAPNASYAAAPTVVFDVRDYGAKGDGKRLNTVAINRAILACAHGGGGTVLVPPGVYLTGTVTLRSHVTLEIAGGATLLASQNPADYPLEPDAMQAGKPRRSPLIDAHDADNITVTGRGTIDGQGAPWWRAIELTSPKKGQPGPRTAAERALAATVRYGRPHLVRFVRCRDVLIEHLYLRNSPEWNVHPLLCEGVKVDGLTIDAPTSSHNTDGINPESCRNVQIANCRIDTGDDCITLKSGKDEAGRKLNRPDENITITNCIMLHGHGGVTIGSEMSGGVRNVSVSNCVFQGTQIGLRVKSQRGRGGVVEGVNVSNIVMQDVPRAFVITMFYSGKDKASDTFPVDAGTPIFRDFVFSNITARGGTSAGSITGLREMPVKNITFSNVHIDAQAGMTLTNTQGITFQNVTINVALGNILRLDNAPDTDTATLRTKTSPPGTFLEQF